MYHLLFIITTSFVCLLHHIFQVMVVFFYITEFIFTKLCFINLNYSNNYKWPINKNILQYEREITKERNVRHSKVVIQRDKVA